MSVASIKKQIRERFGNQCADCGLPNDAQLEKFGRGLHAHRVIPGSAYSVEGCVLLCTGCHAVRHGAKQVTASPKGLVSRERKRQVQFRLPQETLGQLDAIAAWLKRTYGTRGNRSVALQYAVKKILKKIPDCC